MENRAFYAVLDTDGHKGAAAGLHAIISKALRAGDRGRTPLTDIIRALHGKTPERRIGGEMYNGCLELTSDGIMKAGISATEEDEAVFRRLLGRAVPGTEVLYWIEEDDMKSFRTNDREGKVFGNSLVLVYRADGDSEAEAYYCSGPETAAVEFRNATGKKTSAENLQRDIREFNATHKGQVRLQKVITED